LARGFRRSFLASVALVAALGRSASGAVEPLSVPDDDTSLPPPAVPHQLTLTLVEQFGALAIQGLWYWGHSRYGSSGAAVTPENFFNSLVSDDLVLDDDLFRTNGVGHPIAGAVAYQISRGNGMSVGASFVSSVLASIVWKYFGEWNQPHSTNDILMSPTAGWVIGEATYRVGRWFAAGEPGILNCIGATALSPFAVINGSSVCKFRNGDRTSSTIVLPTWHRLGADVGPSMTIFNGGQSRAGIMIGLIEMLIEREADLIERVQDEVERMAPVVFGQKGAGQPSRNRRLDVLLKTIGREGDVTARALEAVALKLWKAHAMIAANGLLTERLSVRSSSFVCRVKEALMSCMRRQALLMLVALAIAATSADASVIWNLNNSPVKAFYILECLEQQSCTLNGV